MAKHLDRLLIYEDMIDQPWAFNSKVLVGGIFDHMPIIVEIPKKTPKPPSPFKLNHSWLKEEDYKSLVRLVWRPLMEEKEISFMFQFVENLARVKKDSIHWAKSFNAKSKALFAKVESQIGKLLIDRSIGSLSNKEETLYDLIKKKDLLDYEEAQWHLKRKVIWLKEGNNNSKKIHKNAKPKENLKLHFGNQGR